jgi:SAM-dependent methyltransferase
MAAIYKKITEKIYLGPGDPNLLRYIRPKHRKILDVGCGNGSNSALIMKHFPKIVADGITISSSESRVCKKIFRRCYLFDITSEKANQRLEDQYDLIIFSHVLEHTVHPIDVLSGFDQVLKTGGEILVIVPNLMHLVNRFKMAQGKFRYTKEGILDFTHLRFFTYQNVVDLLIDQDKYQLKSIDAIGHFTLGIFRRIISKKAAAWFDRLAVKAFPSFFGESFVLLLQKKESK